MSILSFSRGVVQRITRGRRVTLGWIEGGSFSPAGPRMTRTELYLVYRRAKEAA